MMKIALIAFVVFVVFFIATITGILEWAIHKFDNYVLDATKTSWDSEHRVMSVVEKNGIGHTKKHQYIYIDGKWFDVSRDDLTKSENDSKSKWLTEMMNVLSKGSTLKEKFNSNDTIEL